MGATRRQQRNWPRNWAAIALGCLLVRLAAVHRLDGSEPAANAAAAAGPLRLSPSAPQHTDHSGVLELVWLAPNNEFWEGDFLRDVLRRTGRTVVTRTVEPEAAACASSGGSFTVVVPRWISLMDRLPPEFQNGSCTYGIIHPSDEGLYEWPAPQYNRPGVHFVLRQYALPPGSLSDTMRPFGLGYKLGFWDRHLGPEAAAAHISARPLAWSFAGTVHHEERRQALELFAGLTPNSVTHSSAFNAPDGLATAAYRDTLLSSRFVLCPLGHVNLDTFRLYEALEAGAIPVSMSTNPMLIGLNYSGPYWPLVFGSDAPWVVADTWEAAYAEVSALLAGPVHQLEQRRQRVLAFWQQHKEDVARFVSKAIES
ncbi:hypothetical protein D9Q98_001289 [Chlorella vulgaris]|uniref:RXYLT1 C-terminal domain-containing protein n=1 Tax=Chlorella vulgaris TaxID=3077 RepID=A0A9D4U063_CHLVU|nr:hypothetical protein D9Q98_001289 [Chlorella vulgaris]